MSELSAKSGQQRDEDTDDPNELVYSLDTFEDDSRQCVDLIRQLSSFDDQNNDEKCMREVERICERFDYLISKWQTNPKLIESHVKQFLEAIIETVTTSAVNGIRFNAAFQLMHRLVSCIGPKSVCRSLPTEVFWLTKLMDWCERQSPEDYKTWPTRAMLLLWLSMAVKTPFHLRKFDAKDETSTQKTITERIYALIDAYLKATDKCIDSAALLSANFFSRPDIVDQLLSRFMNESFQRLLQSEPSLGHVMAVGVLFKVGDRQDINPYAHRVIEMSMNRLNGYSNRSRV
ncbi:unnamed protein product [Oppiella nova]|uniref:Uncharacterized protein n=1 Tax=Oppiella nova TaxID=334625 RepID=A0A7R9LMV0_9ACAR|nr:unnamed protein product [Oppiella nova]CAG2164592.1 unnamed protein product [Oppiella nova]